LGASENCRRSRSRKALMAPSFARNTVLGFASGAAVSLSGFIGNAITARVLGPDNLGIYAYVVLCVTVASTIAALGMDLVQQRFIPNLRAEGRNDEADGLIGATTRLSLVAAFVGGLLLFAYLDGPGRSVLQGSSPTSRIVVVTVALAWFICWRMADLYLFNVRGEQRFGELARVSAVSALLKVATMALGAWIFGIPGALAGYIAANILPASRMFRLLRHKPSVGQALRREVIGFALVSWTIALIGSLVFGRTQILFLEHYTGIGAVGLFTAAVTVAEMAAQLPPLLLSALLPRFSEQHGKHAHDHMQRLYRTMTALIAMVIVPLCLCLAAIAPVLLPLVFGADFADAVPAAAVLLIASAVSSLGGTTLYLILSVGKTGLLLISNAVGLAATIALGFLLIPRFGLMGAAWSRGIVQVVVILLETALATLRLGIAPSYRALGAITAASVAEGAVAYGVVTELGGAISLVVAVPAAIVTYLVALRWLAVIPMVDPGLNDKLLAHAPQPMKPTIRFILKLLSPPARGHADSD
jgi:O-antigen/teichoic acid export membrane protein